MAQGMSSQVRIFRVDAFTAVACTGNPACVVLDAGALEEHTLQSLTRELGGVDVAFVLPPDAADHDLRLRFFTPRTETGLVGHATLAAHAVLDALGYRPARRQKQRGGVIDIEQFAGAHGTLYAFSQPLPALHGPLPSDRLTPILSALGVAPAELDPDCPPVVAGAGGNRALIALRSGATLAHLRPDLFRLAQLSATGSPAGFFVYSLAPAIPDCDTEARMFCPALGIAEDPVSGNAHALLAARLCAVGRMPERSGTREFIARQGHHMGRPGTLWVRVSADSGGGERVRVAGRARIVFEATLNA